ncbi:hypothetical protein TH5_02290 [Thalassospira xianhensis MCCC 1A02616]|uniref:WYL domain-containing protein n=1 Tax=Thalassospira xianhensis MCCC 1A02616 TaxID=1177929 RepID=A0A367UIL2_9PROT|nr:hypothetical protein TH5_02290 [Thalassospira xianhensis MCCC 1A02616]
MRFDAGQEVEFTYRNWRGKTARRRVLVKALWFGTSEWHKGDQWFLRGEDLERPGTVRDFALSDIAPNSLDLNS